MFYDVFGSVFILVFILATIGIVDKISSKVRRK